MAVTLRRARPEEAVALGDIGFAAWAASAFAVADAGRVDRDKLLAEFRAFGLEYAATTLVAELDGAPLGWGAREDHDQRISDLWVAPAAQGRGVGAMLLGALVEEIRAAGYPQAELETLASNQQAVGFYQRHGFSIVWRREKFSPSLGYAIDKVGMNKSLTP
jgi:ribosomal-protein-alanine N-acetyltransferase